MFNTLYLLSYNNYYNRLVKQETTLANYLEYEIEEIQNYNFNPNDHVTTEIIVNIPDTSIADYLLVVDEFDNIDSRWFILDSTRVRSGQYRLSLYRDTIVDYYNVLKESVCFIEKGIVPASSPLIFNKEDMTFNQIKTSEVLLKDKTKCSWLVAYIAKEKAAGQESAITINTLPPGVADFTLATRDDFEYSNLVDNLYYGPIQSTQVKVSFQDKVGFNDPEYLSVYLQQLTPTSPVSSRGTKVSQNEWIASPAARLEWSEFYQQYNGTFYDVMWEAKNYMNGQILDAKAEYPEDLARFLDCDGKTIAFADERKVYKIKIEHWTDTSQYGGTGSTIPTSNPFWLALKELWPQVFTSDLRNGSFFNILVGREVYFMTLEYQNNVNSIVTTIPENRLLLADAPYSMICAPYESVQMRIGNDVYQTSTENTMAVFNELIRQGAGGDNPWLYDVQRLPYCPIDSIEMDSDDIIDTAGWNNSKQLFPIQKDEGGTKTTIGALFAASVSNFSTTIVLEEPIEITYPKIENQCDMYRLCSPNYNGVFEFNAAQNGGVSYFNVDCSYKPFNPYIQVSPNFSGLYGKDFNDARGLICGGEWGLPMLTSAWQTYERQNANYNTIFNRQIQNMEVTNAVQREQDIWAAIAGTVQGGASGAMVGGLLGGGGAGMIGGGVAGAVVSGIAGARDVELNNRLRGEAIDYAKDNFGYQLGNIKALPSSLSRVGAFTVTNKIFPFLEYYTCTDEEKEALAYKIAYNGMTVMKIDKLGNYMDSAWSYFDIVAQNYVKAKLIKCDVDYQDYHITNTIAKELNLGLFFKGGN